MREELDLADGLADPNVVVLDPCCGTGAYLVEVLKQIAETLRDKGGDALVASDLKKAAMTRVFGFEILPAPFVVSHLQLGLMLQDLGAPLSHKKNERVGVYLTNALTGWEPPKDPKQQVMASAELARGTRRGRTRQAGQEDSGGPGQSALQRLCRREPRRRTRAGRAVQEGPEQAHQPPAAGASRSSTSTICMSASSAWPSGGSPK